LIIVGVAALVGAVALYVSVAYHLQHRGERGRYTFPLVGTRPVTDAEPIGWSRDVLVSDGRWTADMVAGEWADGSQVNRGANARYVTVVWRDPKTFKEWFVHIERMPDKVECVANLGK
jgi:hypothetical protein